MDVLEEEGAVREPKSEKVHAGKAKGEQGERQERR